MFALIFAIFQFREEENLKIVEEKYESSQFSCIRIITNLFIAICNIYRNGAHHDPARVKCCNLHVDHLLESTLGLLHVLSRSPKNAEFISNKVFNTGLVNEIKKPFSDNYTVTLPRSIPFGWKRIWTLFEITWSKYCTAFNWHTFRLESRLMRAPL